MGGSLEVFNTMIRWVVVYFPGRRKAKLGRGRPSWKVAMVWKVDDETLWLGPSDGSNRDAKWWLDSQLWGSKHRSGWEMQI